MNENRCPFASQQMIYGVLKDHLHFLAAAWQGDVYESARSLQWELDHDAIRSASKADSDDIFPTRSAAEFEIAQQLLKKGAVTDLAYSRNVPRPLPASPWPIEGENIAFEAGGKFCGTEVVGRAFRCVNAIYAVHPAIDAEGPDWRYTVSHVASGRGLHGVAGSTADEAESAARLFLQSVNN